MATLHPSTVDSAEYRRGVCVSISWRSSPVCILDAGRGHNLNQFTHEVNDGILDNYAVCQKTQPLPAGGRTVGAGEAVADHTDADTGTAYPGRRADPGAGKLN